MAVVLPELGGPMNRYHGSACSAAEPRRPRPSFDRFRRSTASSKRRFISSISRFLSGRACSTCCSACQRMASSMVEALRCERTSSTTAAPTDTTRIPITM